MLISVLLPLALVSSPFSALAKTLSLLDLTPGDYLPKTLPCSALGGSGSSHFDGKNLNFHYQYCITKKSGAGTDAYEETCVEHQGPNPPMTEAQISTDPDKEIFAITVQVLGPKNYKFDQQEYRLCN